MPTVDFDISGEVANLIDDAIKDGGPRDFNPGQQAAWANVTCNIEKATTSVYIAGPVVDVTTEISVKCSGAEYISEAVAELEETCSALGQEIDNGWSWKWLRSDLIGQAFDSL